MIIGKLNLNGGFFVKKLLTRYISVILTALILITCIPINAFASFSDVPANAVYSDALTRLASLGIISSQGKFNPDSPLTREQFAAMIVIAAGFENMAVSMKGTTDFPDIANNAWSSGYINAAVAKGYMGAMADGKFHPTQAVTYMQLCAMLVRALGYTTSDLTGTFPYNYVTKAYDLGLTDGISLSNNANVPRWVGVTMIDRLLDTNMKQVTASTMTMTFMEFSGYYIKCIVYGDSSTIDSVSKGQVLTDKGIYNNPSNIKLELGSENYVAVKNGNIVKASGQSSILKISVDQVADNKVTYKSNGRTQSIVIPDNIAYYYQGQKIDFTKLTPLLQKNSSIVFNYNSDKNGYSFAVVFDPVYSKPEIAHNFVPSSKVLGSISFGDNPLIIRNGDSIDISQIEEKDIVYQVTDIWNSNKYITVVDNKVGGIITDVLPNKLSPKTIQIDGTNYDISKDMDTNIISSISGSIAVDNNIIISLGHDNKIVNIENFGAESNSDYALVLNSTYTITPRNDGTKDVQYSVKLLFSNGVTGEYNVPSDSMQMKGDLVKYKIVDPQNITLEQVYYNYPGETVINKDERLLGSQYISDNVKIFNIVYNDTGSEVKANLIKWSDMPSGTITEGKIWYTNETGLFGDASIILANDIFDQRNQLGVVMSTGTTPTAKGSTTQYTINVHGKEYTYNQHLNISGNGYVYQFKMASSGIDSLVQSVTPFVSGTTVQAIDGKRVKLSDKIYFFKNNVSVYYKDIDGVVTTKTLADISSNQSFGHIDLYSGANDGKVDVIFITE